MAMRHLITGQGNCAPDGASSSNPLGNFANALLGQSSKAQSIKELPGAAVNVPSTSELGTAAPLSTIPGSENEFKQHQLPFARGADFIRGSPAEDWIQSFRPPGLQEFVGPEAHFKEFDQIYNNTGATFGPALDGIFVVLGLSMTGCPYSSLDNILQHIIMTPKIYPGPPQRVLSGVLHSFLESGRAGVPFQPVPVPALGLSESDKQCIRDRSCIMARHILADQPEEYIQAQVNTLLHSLDINSDYRMKGPLHGPLPEMEEYWNQSQSAMRSAPMHNAADKWITEFGQQNNNPENWALSFEQQYGPNGWASEFEQHQSQMAVMGGSNMANLAAMEQSRMLAQTLASNNDPKFQNSKFFQFVSKMSRGELIIEDNEVKQGSASQSSGWADEFQTQYNANANSWADQFVHEEISQGADKWASEFSSEHNQGGLNENWIDEFSKLHVGDEWAEEFGGGAFGESSADPWVDEFQNQLSASKQNSGASRGVYVFSDMNPYVGHPNPMQEGQELFHKGLLSEAVLALEAEVLKNPDNAEGWRLLGITHAENDDDQQAIAAMMRAQEANPTNLEVLLALGVSHTNGECMVIRCPV
ncbi:hypothetical protein GUJ93_ZPchr0008g11969 [Zizania palustris]|uniref:Peroxisome biogenesis protein 5 n=1 Tax=Zizania palustris TaxID=103762 RepID=A0A8J5VKA6_ZIZPA|nr:hypothetical protein GUJ93_ZPchr0008g11969 [Zizania palustris]